MKDASVPLVTGKSKLESWWDITTYPLEWLKLIQLNTKLLEFSYIVDEYVPQYNQFVKYPDNFLESETYT